jgi:hypothetical protein
VAFKELPAQLVRLVQPEPRASLVLPEFKELVVQLAALVLSARLVLQEAPALLV